jgi:VPDSG-CTERM motif
MKIASKIATAFAVLAIASTAHAAKISGVISFDGQATINGTNNGVSAFTGVTAGIPITGSFSSVAPNTAVTIAAPWFFNSGPIANFWSVGGFTFNLSSSSIIFQSGPNVLVGGTGMITGNGFEPTPGTWSYSSQNGQGANVRFSASSNSVPDGGATLALLGASFLGLGGLSRLVRRK